MEPDLRIDVLTLLLDRQERAEHQQAERQFNQAMNAVQAEIQPVVRDAENKQTNSRYAKLETIDAAIRPIYTRHGFSLSFNQAPAAVAGNIRITCRCSHAGGHTEMFEREEPADIMGPKGAPTKTVLHGAVSTETYLRRALTCGIFNVQLRNQDDDGVLGGTRFITTEQAEQLEALIKETGTDRARFMEHFGTASISNVKADDFAAACNMLHEKARRQRQRAGAAQ